MKNPTSILACKVDMKIFEKVEQALFTGENKQRFLSTAIERELVRRAVKKCEQ
jgi:hexokinase